TPYHRAKDIEKARRSAQGYRTSITRWKKQIEESQDVTERVRLRAKIKDAETQIGRQEQKVQYLTEQQPAQMPASVRDEIEDLEARLMEGTKAFKADRRIVGTKDVVTADGTRYPGAFGEGGAAYRGLA